MHKEIGEKYVDNISLNEIEDLINLVGGIVNGNSMYQRIGWNYKRPSHKQIETIKRDHNISFGSHFLINRYAGASFGRLNVELRKRIEINLSPFVTQFSNLLNIALDELPSYNNKIVWRWINYLPSEAIEFLKSYIGKNVMIPQFLSTSTRDCLSYNTFFKIKTCNYSSGKYIASIVGKNSEQEVLFKSRTVFKLKKFENTTFYLREIKSKNYSLSLVENFWE